MFKDTSFKINGNRINEIFYADNNVTADARTRLKN